MSQSNGGKPTVKQQRAAQREAKLAQFKKQQAREKRTKKIGIAAAITAGVAVVGLVVGFVVVPALIPEPPREPAALGEIEEFPEPPVGHVGREVDYEEEYGMFPPAGGEHNQAWLNCGIYDQEQRNVNAVHSLEHGAVWFTYNPDDVQGDDLEALREIVPDQYAILSPFPGLDAPIALSAWGAQLKIDDPADEAVAGFMETYWRSPNVPEPGASCSGAIEGPGRVAA